MNLYRANSICALHHRTRRAAAGVGRLFFFAVLIGLLAACTGARGLTKRGAEMEAAGLYTEAANFYFNALLRDRTRTDARIGLNNTAGRVFNDKLDVFSRHRAMDEHGEAVAAYTDAMAYRDRIARVGINLDMASHFEDDFKYSKSAYLRTLYARANDLMAERRFDEAKAIFKDVMRLDPDYKDVTELKGVALNEPLYMSATAHFDAGRYREAFFDLDQIVSNDPDYRDAAILRAEALELGRFPIALSPFENATPVNNIERRVYAFFITALSEIDDPFVRVVERDNMDKILDEQRLSLSGIVDERTAGRVGNLLGAKALLTATVLSYSSKPGRVRVTEKEGFESYRVKLYNPATERNYFETRYRPVKYNEYFNRNEVSISIQYKAISLESGELLFSRITERTEEDQMYYAAYDGEVNNLFPAGPQGVLTSNRDRQRLQNLIRAPRTIRSVDELSSAAIRSAAEQLNRDLTDHLNKVNR